MTLDELHHHTRLLNQADYKDVVRERSIRGHCGYPPCGEPLTAGEFDKGKIKISLAQRKTFNNVRPPPPKCSSALGIVAQPVAVAGWRDLRNQAC